MKLLLHICCANCGIFPFERMRANGIEVVGYFFNPNIHPYQEYQKRLEALKQYSESTGLEVLYRDEYLLEEFLRNVSSQPDRRCAYCYSLRLEATAREAKERGFDQFSTTLLQSSHQDHQLIKETGERIAGTVGLPFYYEDFRPGWRRGLEVSKEMGLYRQQYCGCIYSEKERFVKSNKMSNDKVQMSNKAQSSNEIQNPNGKVFDLEERTGRFGEAIIEFVKTLERNEINRPLIGQLVDAGTSIGANYMEADGAESKKDFRHKVAICKKEAKESKHWLRMIRKANPHKAAECHKLWQEAHELTLIFSSIILSNKRKDV
jgi:four helix bundle protein